MTWPRLLSLTPREYEALKKVWEDRNRFFEPKTCGLGAPAGHGRGVKIIQPQPAQVPAVDPNRPAWMAQRDALGSFLASIPGAVDNRVKNGRQHQ